MRWSITAVSLLVSVYGNAETKITSSFSAAKPLLPSSQYTPASVYEASVWVFNEGRRYSDSDYNKIWATPPNDAAGREWFHPDYELTDGSGSEWQTASAPFSSDTSYKGKKSFRWTTLDITADIYMRRSFNLDKIPAGTIYLSCGHDDAPAEWYINGVEVFKVSDGWNNDEVYLLTDEQKALLKANGEENIIAVHVHQNHGGAFADCGLYESDMSLTNTFLNSVGEGTWPCRYYFLNRNSDISKAESHKWYSPDEDEADWIVGIGPFSNDRNIFFTTEWASQERPILIRRHFNITADELKELATGNGELIFSCSYDENPKVYLNGVKIWETSGWNDNDYKDVRLTDDQRKLIHEGDNLIAVSLTQGGGGGHVDFNLRLVKPYDPGSSGTVTPQKRQ